MSSTLAPIQAVTTQAGDGWTGRGKTAQSMTKLLADAIAAWKRSLQAWSRDGSLQAAADEALVLEGDTRRLDPLVEAWASGEFAGLPPVHLLAGAALPGAAGAYSAHTGSIYLNGDWLARAVQADVIAVLTEELGHHLDAQINAIETPGDEGEHFSLLLLGKTITPAQLAALKAENDHTSILVDGNWIAVEQAVINGDANNNNLVGTSGSDEIYGFNGNDTINSGLGMMLLMEAAAQIY